MGRNDGTPGERTASSGWSYVCWSGCNRKRRRERNFRNGREINEMNGICADKIRRDSTSRRVRNTYAMHISPSPCSVRVPYRFSMHSVYVFTVFFFANSTFIIHLPRTNATSYHAVRLLYYTRKKRFLISRLRECFNTHFDILYARYSNHRARSYKSTIVAAVMYVRYNRYASQWFSTRPVLRDFRRPKVIKKGAGSTFVLRNVQITDGNATLTTGTS